MTRDNYEAAGFVSKSSMRIKDAMPRIFQRAYPVLDPQTKMLSAMSLVRFQEIDALPLSFEGGGKGRRAVSGFSSLARLMVLAPERLASFLEQPCEGASEPLTVVRATEELGILLETFAKTRFGFARVEERTGVGALSGLSDVVELYETGKISTGMTIKEVGSPIFSMPGKTSLKSALQEMFHKRIRRVFLTGSRVFVSDREIIGHVFSPAVLNAMLQRNAAKEEVLDMAISAVGTMKAKEVSPDSTLKEAARALNKERRGQCLVLDRKVVTPWDVVMKPWIAGALKLKSN